MFLRCEDEVKLLVLDESDGMLDDGDLVSGDVGGVVPLDEVLIVEDAVGLRV